MGYFEQYSIYFDGYNVPRKIQEITTAIMVRFSIRGICDAMYISNVIAHTSGIGDGEGHFTGEIINDAPAVAKAIYSSYGRNIFKEDILELEEIVSTGTLNKEKAIAGMKNFISKCKEEKKYCDEWRVPYLNQRIAETAKNLKYVM